jgi:hypothetical protein
MRTVERAAEHLVVGLLLLALAIAGGLALVLYDPFSGSTRFMSRSQLITAPPHATAVRFSRGRELPVQDTDPPSIASLALRYQPTLVVSALDRNWPVSLVSLLGTRWKGQSTCIYIAGRCQVKNPTAMSLDGAGSRSDYIRYPTPLTNVEDTFWGAAQALGVPVPELEGWPHDLATMNPFASAQDYFYYLARTRRRSYPGAPAGLISLEYWFLYPLNYFPTFRYPLQALVNPIGATIANSDYHQGDLEHVAVLLDPKTKRPRYLWMARHANEGQLYRWGSSSVQWEGSHPTIYAALGSHASYAHCGIQRRSRTYWFINDYVVCKPHQDYGFLYSTTPLVDLAHTTWGCWLGRLGQAGRTVSAGSFSFVPYEEKGPFSPLSQQENFGIACRHRPGIRKPAPSL